MFFEKYFYAVWLEEELLVLLASLTTPSDILSLAVGISATTLSLSLEGYASYRNASLLNFKKKTT